jgi:endonuclease-8
MRLVGPRAWADLRGPAACELLDEAERAALLGRLGPDPLRPDADPDRAWRRISASRAPVATLLMDQTVLGGIGNIYRAELLFRARLDPHTPGRRVPREVARALWDDWAVLLEDGIRTGVMLTREDLTPEQRERALADPTERHWVYHRTGLPCLVSGNPVVVEGMATRKLYWCPVCQV